MLLSHCDEDVRCVYTPRFLFLYVTFLLRQESNQRRRFVGVGVPIPLPTPQPANGQRFSIFEIFLLSAKSLCFSKDGKPCFTRGFASRAFPPAYRFCKTYRLLLAGRPTPSSNLPCRHHGAFQTARLRLWQKTVCEYYFLK